MALMMSTNSASPFRRWGKQVQLGVDNLREKHVSYWSEKEVVPRFLDSGSGPIWVRVHPLVDMKPWPRWKKAVNVGEGL